MSLPTVVGDDEAVVSFVLESNKFKGSGVDHRQLMPSIRHGNTSVYRIAGLSEAQTAAAGHVIALERPKPGILGWAELVVLAIRAAQPLRLNAAEPPPRHALIEGWPPAIEDKRTMAMALASKAKTVKRCTVP